MTFDDGSLHPSPYDYQIGSLPVTWKQSRTFQFGNWDYFRTPDTISEDEARVAVSRLLTPGFVTQTISQIDPNSEGSISGLTVESIQGGFRYAIFRVDTSTGTNVHPFILILSKGSPQLNEEIKADFKNLKDLYGRMVNTGIVPFVPKVFVLGEGNGAAGFSVEYLADHVEMNVKKSALLESYGVQFPEYWANTETWQQFFNLHSSDVESDLDYQLGTAPEDQTVLTRTLFDSQYVRLHEGITAEIVGKLCVIHSLTDCVPRDFSINAGDIMGKLGIRDIDLRVTTIRGGWQQCKVEQFVQWMVDHREEIPEFYGGGVIYPFNKRNITQGIRRGLEILGRGK